MQNTVDWPRCSYVAEEACDPRVGTAPPAQQWFLVEHRGPWGRTGYAGSRLDPAAVDALSRWARGTGGRVLLVRRPGRAGPHRPHEVRRWFQIDSRPGREAIRSGDFVDERQLVGILAATPTGDPGGTGRTRPMVLVCTHGRHDACCAVRGRPVAAALAVAEPEGTWECSHIGGCRFAPAVVLLPHGLVFGGVPSSAAVELLDRYRAGVVDGRWVRGPSSLPPVMQAAQQAAREHLGALGVDQLRPAAFTGDEARWEARFSDPPCRVHLTERRVDTGRPLTCQATRPGWMRVFDSVGVEPEEPAADRIDDAAADHGP